MSLPENRVYSPIIQKNAILANMCNLLKLHEGLGLPRYLPLCRNLHGWNVIRVLLEPLHPIMAIPQKNWLKNLARCRFNLPGIVGFVGHDAEAFIAIVWVLT